MASESDRRQFGLSCIDDLNDWPNNPSVPGERFCLLLLIGASPQTADVVSAFTDRALQQGMVNVSIYGEDAHWVEDAVDSSAEMANASGLVTSAHEDLTEALSFFETDVQPPRDSDCRLWWIVVVGRSEALRAAAEQMVSRHRLIAIDWQ